MPIISLLLKKNYLRIKNKKIMLDIVYLKINKRQPVFF